MPTTARKLPLLLSLLFAAALSFGCTAEDMADPGAGSGKADSLEDVDGGTCQACAAELLRCETLANEAKANLQDCWNEFASCHVDVTGEIIPCSGTACEQCVDHAVDRQDMIDQSLCIMDETDRSIGEPFTDCRD